MNINDPFGRMARREEKEYESLCAALRSEGIDSRAKAEAVLARIRRRALNAVAAVLIVALVAGILFPELKILSIITAVIIVFWVLRTTANGRRHVGRYIQEILTR